MSNDPGRGGGGLPQDDQRQPSEEELRAAYEAELSRITSTDMIVQAAVSLLNIGGRRLGAPRPPEGAEGASQNAQAAADPERDLEQVRDAVDAVRALLEILDRRLGKELGPLREALSQLQMAYAREVQLGGAPAAAGAGGPSGAEDAPAALPGAGAADTPADDSTPASGADGAAGNKGPGPAESSGRLWVPGR